MWAFQHSCARPVDAVALAPCPNARASVHREAGANVHGGCHARLRCEDNLRVRLAQPERRGAHLHTVEAHRVRQGRIALLVDVVRLVVRDRCGVALRALDALPRLRKARCARTDVRLAASAPAAADRRPDPGPSGLQRPAAIPSAHPHQLQPRAVGSEPRVRIAEEHGAAPGPPVARGQHEEG
eukprot:1623288-Prymnesium_polylepis.1